MLRENAFLQELRVNVVLQERRANACVISEVNVAIAMDISFVFLIKSFLCSAHISVVIPTAEKVSLL